MTKRDLTREQMAKIFEDFLKGTGGKWDWEAFTDGYPPSDSRLEVIRVRSMNLPTEFPPTPRREYANEQGRQVLRNYITCLRKPINEGVKAD
jgi:hypothetical protein